MKQSTLFGFVKKDKTKKEKRKADEDTPADTEDGDGAEEEEDEEDNNMNVDVPDSSRPIDKKAAPSQSHLPPISDIPAIFTDLVAHVPDIARVAARIKGRPLRVATMCSGTESPLLALELIQASIAQLHHTTFEVEHVFSCEIEPFKQAYIERNFSPPILFRDVCELGDDEACVFYSCL